MDQTLNRRLEVALARAEFLAGGEVDQVRPVIAASWQRSRLAGVDALTSHAAFHDDLDVGGRLVWAAHPVLDRLADEASGMPLSVALTDARSRLLLRVDTEPRIGRLLDGVFFAAGFDYGESSVGTNGVGTAFESRQPLTINGPEHFSERLQPFSCTGAPIRDPLTGHVEGILDITCLLEDSSPILRSLVRSATADIERALLLERGQDQQVVFDAYLRLGSRAHGAVGAMGTTVLLSNQTMHALFTPQEREELRTHARYLVDTQDRADDIVELTTATRARVRALRVLAHDRVVGVVFEASRLQAIQPTPIGGGTPHPSATLRTPGWRRAITEVSAALNGGVPLLVVGERSTGRASLLRECFLAARPDGRVAEVTAADEAAAVAAAIAEETIPTLVLLRRLDRWDPTAADAVRQLADQVRAPHVFAATLTGDAEVRTASELMAPFEACVMVPPLRHREQDVPLLVEAILSEAGRARPVSPAALYLLSHAEWPGNLAELRTVVLDATARRPAGRIEVDDLPATLSTPTMRPLGAMESAEREAIVAALRDTDGNRLRAAQALGISRATLYRKLRQFGLGELG